jgi:hypothetical protein
MNATSGEKREHGSADGPHVRLSVDIRHTPIGLLGRHEPRGAQHRATLRELCGRQGAHTGDPKVEDLQLPAIRDEQVGGLDVTVNDAGLVCRSEHVAELAGDREHLLRRQLATILLPHVFDSLPSQELHHEEGRAILCHVVIRDGDDPWVTHRIRGMTFAHETLSDVAHARELAMEDLDRHAMAVSVARCVHSRHSARSQNSLEPVLPGKNHPHP